MASTKTRAVLDAASMTKNLLVGAYPGFVYGGPASRGVPVFCFHGVEPVLLEQQLGFLTENGYRTLSTNELHRIATGDRRPDLKSVMLTFDDGWGSLWSVGLPLFKKYNVRIVVLLAAGRIPSGDVGPTMDDRAHGRAHPTKVPGRDSSDHPLLTWEEVRSMHDTGLVDFQSHTLTHARIFSSPRIVDFARPSILGRYTLLQMPEWSPEDPGPPRLGRPMYASAPRTGEARRYLEDPDLRAACEDYVAEQGGGQFFHRAGWRRELLGWVNHYRMSHTSTARYETDEERAQAVWRELRDSKELIEERLPGKSVTHVGYPWHCHSRLAVELSAKAGYLTNFVGKVRGRFIGIRPGEPCLVARVGGDFLFTLPGKGRVSLLRVLFSKLVRRSLSPES